jgi:hypothetical protein
MTLVIYLPYTKMMQNTIDYRILCVFVRRVRYTDPDPAPTPDPSIIKPK